MFETEQFVYLNLVKVYERIQEKHNIAPEHRFKFPKYYGGNEIESEETVVMEDLVAKGFSLYSRFKPIDWEHAAHAVESLAKFHALSFALAKDEPELFDKILDKVKFVMPENIGDPATKETWNRMMDGAVQITKDEYKKKMTEFLSFEIDSEEVYKFRKPLSVPVLCHGDYRVSNLMFHVSFKLISLIFMVCSDY